MSEEIIDSLLIIGNGSDRYCGLKSTFKDYLENKDDYIKKLRNWINNYKSFLIEQKDIGIFTNDQFDVYLDKYRYIIPIFEDKMTDEDKRRNGFLLGKLKTMNDIILINEKNNIFSNKHLSRLNFWDIVISNNISTDNPNWYDVETTIRDFLVPYELNKPSDAMLFDSLMNQVKKDRNRDVYTHSIFDGDKINISFGPDYIKNYFKNDETLCLFVIAYKYFNMWKYDNVYEFLLHELNIFENSFEKYLSNIVKAMNESSPNNKGDVKNRLYDKLNLNLFRFLSGRSNTNIFNFNYTTPFINDLRNKSIDLNVPISDDKDKIKATKKHKIIDPQNAGKICHERNIHGVMNNDSKYVDSSIILGIDTNYYKEIPNENLNFFKKDKNLKDNIDLFTKARRIMDFSGINRDKDYNTILNPNVQRIRFFGHSLGEADYSYFQAIFDFYNIYENPIILEFIYSIHYDEFDSYYIKQNDHFEYERLNAEQMRKQNNKVFKLINDYGKTLDNPNHGSNLLQKLLTEGRIRILSIDELIENYNKNNF